MDFEECNIITNSTLRNECFEKYGNMFASRTNNSQICEYIPQKDGCYSEIAIKTFNKSLCSEINDSETSHYCYTAIALSLLNYSICNSIRKNAEKESCIFEIIKKKKDYKKCNTLKILNESCEDYFFCGVNTSICYPYSGRQIRNEIKTLLEKSNFSQCNSLPGLPRQFCYFEYAISSLNESFCEKLDYSWGQKTVKPNLRTDCFLAIAIFKENQELCNKTHNALRDGCIEQILIKKGVKNITRKENMRGNVWIHEFGDSSALMRINEGNVYTNSTDYGCYGPGVVMPGTECLYHYNETQWR